MKRAFDLILILLSLVVVVPVAIIISILVFRKLGRPVIFSQLRPGKNGKAFKLYKFRTMTSEEDEFGKLLPNEKRMTKFGLFLRHSSLDELPEIYNVIKGEMSIVGPRPLLMDYLPLYNDFQNKRHKLRPGITGWAQINGRNAISWDDKFKLDVWYVENQSFWLDLKIIWLTFYTVFKKEGITHEGDVAMPRFTGNNSGQKVKYE
ncbi:MAG: sugar transferase [Bacteroidales bacterium]|nr:sugar transferase [Bacteroidales bacterium]MCF8392059.1 sugar transferase [Bacteroidales bacterium]